MNKKSILLAIAVIFFYAFPSHMSANNDQDRSNIRRLTHSGSNVVQYPCLSEDGKRMVYVIEIKKGDQTTKAIRFMNIEDGKEKELFRDGIIRAPEPYQDKSLVVGTKPPVLSGDGGVAVFSLSLGKPVLLFDHLLAVVNTDGTDFRIIHFPIDALKGNDLKSNDFTSRNWERVSNYALSEDGNRIACAVKGHLGPVRYGSPSGIVFIDTQIQKQRTILAPDFNGKEWEWLSLPQRPLTGGGWAFGMSGNGEKVMFGAQSSTDMNDYDLYTVNWDGTEMRRITDFQDRWFSQADISRDGGKVVFFYSGRKKQGIGTYTVNTDGTELRHLKSQEAPRVELVDTSGNGRYVLFKDVYRGMMLDLFTGKETVAFNEETPGYITGIMPMDFPRIPAFWSPRFMSYDGDRILLVGPPQGKETPEIFLLSIELREQR